ncbi:MAG: ribonuclease HII [Candidatus Zambryskibacteria bacterium]|nr:ribonuclease HII [Candidatus Zambryskibacteria bacterium]
MQFIAGIDEAGRGPLAGPVAVGVVSIPADFNPTSLKLRGTRKNFFKGIKDSKKLTAEERELWFALATEARRKGELNFKVSLVSEKVIDRHGISYALRLGIKRCLAELGTTEDSQIFLDGALKAPEKFKHQLTVIRGDEKIPVISLASICAKVIRDRKMVRLSKKFPQFNFDIHKGYGTFMHRQALRKYGRTVIHRQSFLRNLTEV